MPPAISDNEEEFDEIEQPSTVTKSGRGRKPVDQEADAEEKYIVQTEEKNGDASDDEEEGDDEDDEVYVVEKIMSHMIDRKGKLLFEVKWEGYEKKSDRTWEPEENLTENASEALNEYFESIGGRERLFADTANALKSKKRNRQSSSTPQASEKRSKRNGNHPADSEAPLSAKAASWKPPPGSWEDHIAQLDACEDEETGKLMVYLTWKNGHKTQHETQVIYQRCPQKMLQFYERHVRIIKRDPDADSVTTPTRALAITNRRDTYAIYGASVSQTHCTTRLTVLPHIAQRLRSKVDAAGPAPTARPRSKLAHKLPIHNPTQRHVTEKAGGEKMKQNDVIAVIIIILFIVLALIAFGIYHLVSVARDNVRGTVTTSSESSTSEDLAD
ncbi:Heterochromatin protein one [Madurella fahalii]|uniref:Heterochromatin protein one n=1 Tax=Madurella fahalii TaxID=1157608 RepID=A0ABQ0GD63_9PEZI